MGWNESTLEIPQTLSQPSITTQEVCRSMVKPTELTKSVISDIQTSELNISWNDQNLTPFCATISLLQTQETARKDKNLLWNQAQACKQLLSSPLLLQPALGELNLTFISCLPSYPWHQAGGKIASSPGLLPIHRSFAAWKQFSPQAMQITRLSVAAFLRSDQEEVGTTQPPSWKSAINPNPSHRLGNLSQLFLHFEFCSQHPSTRMSLPMSVLRFQS